jgi:hypothetical protein
MMALGAIYKKSHGLSLAFGGRVIKLRLPRVSLASIPLWLRLRTIREAVFVSLQNLR